MELLYTPTSPFARVPRIWIRELGLEVTETLVDPLANDPELLDVSPLGKVPVLKTDTGVLHDSRVISAFLLSMAGRGTPPDWADATLEATANGVLDVAVSVVMERRRSPDETSPGFVDRQLQRIARTLDREPVPSRTELSPGRVALACALGYLDFRLPEVLWRDRRPDLADWFAAQARRPSFVDTLPPA